MGKKIVEQLVNEMKEGPSKYFSVYQGQGYELVYSGQTERAMKKAEGALVDMFKNDPKKAEIKSQAEENAVRVLINSSKHGAVDMLLVAENDAILSDKFTKIINSKELKRLGTIMVDCICQNGRVTKLPQSQIADEM